MMIQGIGYSVENKKNNSQNFGALLRDPNTDMRMLKRFCGRSQNCGMEWFEALLGRIANRQEENRNCDVVIGFDGKRFLADVYEKLEEQVEKAAGQSEDAEPTLLKSFKSGFWNSIGTALEKASKWATVYDNNSQLGVNAWNKLDAADLTKISPVD